MDGKGVSAQKVNSAADAFSYSVGTTVTQKPVLA
jgi:hypothetical protein